MYRAVKENDGNTVIAIGMDEGQTGAYHDVGVWCDFTFEEIPVAQGALAEYLQSHDYHGSILKVVDGEIVLRTVEEIS